MSITQRPALRAFHRHVWQRIPYRWRRAALFRASALAAPRPTRAAPAGQPIIVAGALRTASGLGESARLCHDALLAQGLPVLGVDLTAALMQAEDHPTFAFRDGRVQEGPGTIIVHVNAPLVPLALWRLGRRLVTGKRIIGYWAWELPDVPPDWRHGLPFVHEIWVPSVFTAKAVSAIAEQRPVHVVPHAVRPHAGHSPRMMEAGRPFTLLTLFNMASSIARKNPCDAITAFRRAFADDPAAQLIVKCTNGALFPDGLRQIERAIGPATTIRFIDAVMSGRDLDDLYDQADAVVSLHRSEGFGLTIAEAMLKRLPVIATDWSGNVDFLDDATGLPIAYHLVPAVDPQGTYHHPGMTWAAPDVDAAAEAMRRLRADPALCRRLGEQAARVAQDKLSPARYAERAAALLATSARNARRLST